MITIIGGRSFRNTIGFVSDKFTAEARYQDGVGINVTVTPHGSLRRWVIRHRNAFMPRLLYLAISLVAGLRWGTIIVGGLVWLGSGFLLSQLLGLYYGHGPGGADAPHQVPTMGDARVFTLAALGAVLAFVHVFVARWHGAEHKVAAAYARDDPAWPDLVRTESRVHELCGGRFLLPLVVLLLAPIRTLTMWIAVEALLWIDKLYGIRRTPLLAQASTLLQKYITTAEPSNAEVETAIAAMRALIAAHDHEHELEKCARS